MGTKGPARGSQVTHRIKGSRLSRFRQGLGVLVFRAPRAIVEFVLTRVNDAAFLSSPKRRRELSGRARERAGNAESWLTAGERAAVTALASVIVPSSDDTPGAAEMDVLGAPAAARMDEWVRASPAKQALYARGLIAFDELAERRWGTPFAQLSETRQHELLTQIDAAHQRRHRDASLPGKVWKKLELVGEMATGWSAAVDLFPTLVQDVFAAFYTSEVSWMWLGYDGPPMPRGYADLEHPRPPEESSRTMTLRGVTSPDRSKARPAGRGADPDVVIIGSGAGGAVVAKELTEAGVNVVVLEVGRRYNPYEDYPTDRTDFELAGPGVFSAENPLRDLYTTGDDRFFSYNRSKGVGGSTLKYVAMNPRLHESDFRAYSEDGVGSDWPITYADLEPYYSRVEYELGVSGPGGSERNPFDPPRSRPYPTPPHHFNLASQAVMRGAAKLGLHMVREPLAIPSRDWNGRPACIGAGTCHMGCSISAKSSMDVTYVPKAEATGRLDLRTESMAFRIELGPGGRARRVLYFDREGREQAVEARIIVVAGNAIETPRLLLLSSSGAFPNGLANSSGLVGKNFMEHLAVFSRGVLPNQTDPWRGTPTGGMIQDDYATRSANGFARGWTTIVTSNAPWPLAAARRVPGWGSDHKSRLKDTFAYSVCLASIGEQLPDARNQVALDPTRKDSFGLPVPHLVNVPRDNDRAMVAAITTRLRSILEAAGCTTITSNELQQGMSSHYLGTCRMGSDPGTSVVDAYGRTHDVPNLFIADGSVFVTGGAVNPALTISALATRTAEEIVRTLKTG
jgi:choline dehydrogenase-like flavoprotein